MTPHSAVSPRPSPAARMLSLISAAEHREWFRQIWTIPGASTRQHPAPYPQELASRLIRMFSFVGDTVLDPFLGTGTTSVAAVRAGRNSGGRGGPGVRGVGAVAVPGRGGGAVREGAVEGRGVRIATSRPDARRFWLLCCRKSQL